MNSPSLVLHNQRGSALILSILVLFILTALGAVAINNTDREMSFSRDDKFKTLAFYQADGGGEASKELIEQAIEERGWASVSDNPVQIDQVWVTNKEFFQNTDLGTDRPSETNRDAYIPVTAGSQTRNTNLRFGANTRLSSGGAIQLVAGYEGKGKAAASGGAWVVYDIRSRHDGPGNTSAKVKAQWLHQM